MMDCTCVNNPNCYKCDGTGTIKNKRFEVSTKALIAKRQNANLQIPLNPSSQSTNKQEHSALHFAVCPYCNNSVKQQRLLMHKLACRKNPNKTAKGSSNKISYKNTQEKNKQQPTSYNNKRKAVNGKYEAYINFYKAEYNLDMSRGFHIRRECGKFGSYPSSDDYGEEANL
jgi:hypothetical protein